MAKLKTLAPRIGVMRSRISPAPLDERDRSRNRDATQPWRAWYKTARWVKLRRRILLRDNYTCQATGVLCVGKHPAENSPVVDHKTPHRGDERLFWDDTNLQVVSKAYHDSTKQAEEARTRHSSTGRRTA